MHSAVVDRLPRGAVALARAEGTAWRRPRSGRARGVFWGVQYHPELALSEIADALRRQSADLIRQDLAESEAAIEAYAGALEALEREPGRGDLARALGLDEEVTDPARRTRELGNFLRHLAGRSASAAA